LLCIAIPPVAGALETSGSIAGFYARLAPRARIAIFPRTIAALLFSGKPSDTNSRALESQRPIERKAASGRLATCAEQIPRSSDGSACTERLGMHGITFSKRRHGRSTAARRRARWATLPLALLVQSHVACAQPAQPGPSRDLVKQANAPISSVLQLRLQDTYQSDFEQIGGDGNVFTLSVTMPLPRYRLLPIPQLSLLSLPAAVTPPHGDTGFGDVRFTDVAVFNPLPDVLLGVGPILVFPTATERNTGQDKWQLGPALVAAYAPERWLLGFLAQNPISIAGDDDRPDTNALVFQPVLTYRLDGGWFIRSQPQMLFNWETDKEIVPIDLGAGRVFRIGRQSINAFVEPFWTAIKDEPAPEWGITVGVGLLYPDFWGSSR
jgi:hypothetical protein